MKVNADEKIPDAPKVFEIPQRVTYDENGLPVIWKLRGQKPVQGAPEKPEFIPAPVVLPPKKKPDEAAKK